MDEAFDLHMMTVFTRPLPNSCIADCSNLIAALLDYHLMAKVTEEMDQFLEGLSTFEFLDIMKANPRIWNLNLLKLTPNLYKLCTHRVSVCTMYM